MIYRTLGRTGLEVSEIGYGAWGIGGAGWIGAQDDDSRKALHHAMDRGLNFVDTAWMYGEGHSERIVGSVVRGRSEEVAVATKVPTMDRRWPAAFDSAAQDVFPGHHIREYTEHSLRNLGLDHIDVLQFHAWSPSWLGQGDWAETVADLKAEGKIRWFGVSINDHEPASGLSLVRSGAADTVQVIYNVFDSVAADELFPACREHGVGVIVRAPFDEGSLTGTVTPDTVFPEGDWRHSYFRDDRRAEVFRRVTAIADELGVPLARMPEIALRFTLADDAVSTTIPGMRRMSSVDANTAVSDGTALTAEQLQLLRAHRWVRNFYT